jgi:hypothetical protein
MAWSFLFDIIQCRRPTGPAQTSPKRLKRSLPVLLVLAVVTGAAGLASRRYPDSLPEFIARYAGDTLWAALVFWLLAIVWRRASPIRLGFVAATIAFIVEFSQLFHSGWIDSLRATAVGGLILGSGFLWSDLACYVVGVGLAAGIDVAISRASTQVNR